jgi:hypothetical protein
MRQRAESNVFVSTSVSVSASTFEFFRNNIAKGFALGRA